MTGERVGASYPATRNDRGEVVGDGAALGKCPRWRGREEKRILEKAGDICKKERKRGKKSGGSVKKMLTKTGGCGKKELG